MTKVRLGSFVALCLAIGGCVGAQPPTTSPGPTASAPSPTLTPTASASVTPTAAPTTRAPTPTPPATTPSGPAADPCASSTAADPATPPDAALAGADGAVVAGRPGSYTYCDVAVDALPPRAENMTAIPLAADVTVTTTGAEGFVAYRAGYWPAAEWQGDEIRYAADELAGPVAEATFPAPPSGDWMLALNLTFASGGEAVYYWHVAVP